MQPRRIRRPLLSTVLLIISLIANFSAFADEPGLVVLDVTLIGNRHTRDHILLRELTFAKGDTLPTGELEKIFKRSEDNLFNTSLFNSTKITWLRDGDGIRVFVIVTERWYIFLSPSSKWRNATSTPGGKPRITPGLSMADPWPGTISGDGGRPSPPPCAWAIHNA